MDVRVDLSLPLSPSRQIVEAVLDTVASGVMEAGAKLPSVRALAKQARVNPNTIARSYRELEAAGVLEGVEGRGVFVAPRGIERARRARHGATLEALRNAVRTALRAGHGEGDVRREVERVLADGAADGDGMANRRARTRRPKS